MPQIKGNTLSAVFRYIKSEFGADALANVKADCLRYADLLSMKIDRDGWYPYGSILEPLEALVKRYHRYDPKGFIEFGRWAAQQDIYHLQLGEIDMSDPHQLLHCADFVWHLKYKDCGSISVTDIGEEVSTTEIDFPQMIHSHCLLIEGWIDEFSKLLLKGHTVKTMLAECVHTGCHATCYRSSWIDNTKPQPLAKIKLGVRGPAES